MTSLTTLQGSVLAICRVHQLAQTATGFGVTAIDKRPVAGPVNFRKMGVFGDVQGDRQHHGGLDQAVYAYSQEDADLWGAELGRTIEPGLFGENLRTVGVPVTDAVLGTRWRIGTTLLEVSAPRTPCATFAERMGESRWVKRFTEAGRIGAYLRVLEPGRAEEGDAITREFVPAHGITVGKFFCGPSLAEVLELQELGRAGELNLSGHVERQIPKLLARLS